MSEEAKSQAEQQKKLGELIGDIKFAMLTTVSNDGKLHSRPMTTQQKDFDGHLWFFTGLSTEIVPEVESNPKVNVSYSSPDKNSSYVSVSGAASVVRDRAKIKELWSPLYKAWFPKGKDDPDLCLLKIDVSEAEYWDMPNSKVAQVYAFAKALVTGEQAKIGEHQQVNVDSKETAA
jgi:general stress protein 26